MAVEEIQQKQQQQLLLRLQRKQQLQTWSKDALAPDSQTMYINKNQGLEIPHFVGKPMARPSRPLATASLRPGSIDRATNKAMASSPQPPPPPPPPLPPLETEPPETAPLSAQENQDGRPEDERTSVFEDEESYPSSPRAKKRKNDASNLEELESAGAFIQVHAR